MAYAQKRNAAERRAQQGITEAQRHERNAKRARIRAAQALLDRAWAECDKSSWNDPDETLDRVGAQVERARGLRS